jgi:hypothetical protein
VTRFLLAILGRGPTALFGTVVAVVGAAWGAGVWLAGQTSPGDYVQGGIAAAAITFAGATVRYMGGMVDKERARGDRLEVALIDKVMPAIGAASTAMQQSSDVVKELMARRGRE